MNVSLSSSSHTSRCSLESLSSDRHCVFRCHQAWFAMPAVSVREITYAPLLTRIPGSHPLLAGMCHLRSEFIPVIQLDALLDNSTVEQTKARKLLVLQGQLGHWAILISEVAALVALETLTHNDGNLDDPSSGVVLGTAMFHDEVVRVLDTHRVLQWAQALLEQHWRSMGRGSLLGQPPITHHM